MRRNVHVRAEAGSPQADAVKVSYTDSVIKALPIKSEKNDGQLVLIDLADLFMTDLADIGIHPDPSRSTWAKVKVFPEERRDRSQRGVLDAQRLVLLASSATTRFPTRAGAGRDALRHVDAAGDSSYKPRLADDRVGHFLSVGQGLQPGRPRDAQRALRHPLEPGKENPAAEKSPPKQPIIFWIERTVPREYRQYVREGILEWNKAFEKIGFIDAIQVRDQQSRRRVRSGRHPLQHLPLDHHLGRLRHGAVADQSQDGRDSRRRHRLRRRDDPLLAAGVHRHRGHSRRGWRCSWPGQRQGFFKLFAARPAGVRGGAPVLDRMLRRQAAGARCSAAAGPRPAAVARRAAGPTRCAAVPDGAGHAAAAGHLAAAVLAARGELEPGGKVPEKLIAQAVKEVVMHEVGHTLGLRHNFKASTASARSSRSTTPRSPPRRATPAR